MKKRVKLSIIIVNYNTRRLTLECIKSINDSDPKVPYEIIVVDNGSDDGSVEALENVKNIKLIKNSDNLGFSKANNIGIKKAKSRYILLLNSDTKVKDGAIDKLYDFAKDKESIGAVGAKLLNSDGSAQASAFRSPSLWLAIRQYWLGGKKLMDKYSPSGDEPREVDVLVMAAFLITPKAIKKVGLLNERYFMFFEDFDYCREIRKAGLKIIYHPGAEVIHYHGASGKKITDGDNQWRRLIASSKIYYGLIQHYLIFFVLWSGQKIRKFI